MDANELESVIRAKAKEISVDIKRINSVIKRYESNLEAAGKIVNKELLNHSWQRAKVWNRLKIRWENRLLSMNKLLFNQKLLQRAHGKAIISLIDLRSGNYTNLEKYKILDDIKNEFIINITQSNMYIFRHYMKNI